jgi:hypothetical protein
MVSSPNVAIYPITPTKDRKMGSFLRVEFERSEIIPMYSVNVSGMRRCLILGI